MDVAFAEAPGVARGFPLSRALTRDDRGMDADDDAGRLRELLEPYLWLEHVDSYRSWGASAGRWFDVTGMVKPRACLLLDAVLPGGQAESMARSNQWRAHLFAAAQAAIRAAEDAGFRHAHHPEITVRGSVRPMAGQDADLMVAEVVLEMWLRPALVVQVVR